MTRLFPSADERWNRTRSRSPAMRISHEPARRWAGSPKPRRLSGRRSNCRPSRRRATACCRSVVADQGRLDEALSIAKMEPAQWARLFALSVVHFRAGRPEESAEALRRLTETMADHAAYQIAVTHAVRGEVDAAFEWLDRASRQRDAGLAVMRTHSQLRPLHGDPRWAQMLHKMRFPD